MTDSVLDEFEPPERVVTRMLWTKARPRPATRVGLAELETVESIEQLRRTKGYMSAAAYRAFAQCERRRDREAPSTRRTRSEIEAMLSEVGTP